MKEPKSKNFILYYPDYTWHSEKGKIFRTENWCGCLGVGDGGWGGVDKTILYAFVKTQNCIVKWANFIVITFKTWIKFISKIMIFNVRN